MKERIYISREQLIWLPREERDRVLAGTHPDLFTREIEPSRSAQRILAGERVHGLRSNYPKEKKPKSKTWTDKDLYWGRY